jgi:hypothetical protein
MLPIILSKHFLLLTSLTLLLLAYLFQTSTLMKTKGFLYNFTNSIGAAILAYLTFRPLQLEFFALASFWTLISVVRLFKNFK